MNLDEEDQFDDFEGASEDLRVEDDNNSSYKTDTLEESPFKLRVNPKDPNKINTLFDVYSDS